MSLEPAHYKIFFNKLYISDTLTYYGRRFLPAVSCQSSAAVLNGSQCANCSCPWKKMVPKIALASHAYCFPTIAKARTRRRLSATGIHTLDDEQTHQSQRCSAETKCVGTRSYIANSAPPGSVGAAHS